MSAADLSVVMPLYNSGPWVAEAIESVLGNADGLLELIVVDDGSTDDGPAIARTYGDPVTVLSQANAGPSAARNAALAIARGDLIGFLDADDIWVAGSPDPRRAALSDPGVDLVMGWLQPVTGDPLRPCHSPIASSLSAWLVRAHLFARHGLLDESLRRGEDLDWLARVRGTGARMEAVDDIVVHYRRRPGSQTYEMDDWRQGVLHAARAALLRGRGEKP